MSADGFCSLAHPDAGFNLIYLRTGLPTFKPASAAGTATGFLVVFTVEDIDGDYMRLRDAGVEIVTPIGPSRGERYFQMADPNGVIYQLVQWVEPPTPPSDGTIETPHIVAPSDTRRESATAGRAAARSE